MPSICCCSKRVKYVPTRASCITPSKAFTTLMSCSQEIKTSQGLNFDSNLTPTAPWPESSITLMILSYPLLLILTRRSSRQGCAGSAPVED